MTRQQIAVTILLLSPPWRVGRAREAVPIVIIERFEESFQAHLVSGEGVHDLIEDPLQLGSAAWVLDSCPSHAPTSRNLGFRV